MKVNYEQLKSFISLQRCQVTNALTIVVKDDTKQVIN